jgi:ribosomal protein L3
LKVAKVLGALGVLLVRGPVPGAANDYVVVQTARKAAIRTAHAKK